MNVPPLLSDNGFVERVDELVETYFGKYTDKYYTDVTRFLSENPRITYKVSSSIDRVSARISRRGDQSTISIAPMLGRDKRYVLAHEFSHIIFDELKVKWPGLSIIGRSEEEFFVQYISDSIFIRSSWLRELSLNLREGLPKFFSTLKKVLYSGGIPHKVACRRLIIGLPDDLISFCKISVDKQRTLFDAPPVHRLNWLLYLNASDTTVDSARELRFEDTRSNLQLLEKVRRSSFSTITRGSDIVLSDLVRIALQAGSVISINEANRDVYLVGIFELRSS